MAANKGKSSIPTSGNLFDIMLDMTESATDLYNIIIKNKLNASSFAKTMNKYIDNMCLVLNNMNDKFTELAKRDWSAVSKVSIAPMTTLIDDLNELCVSLHKLNPDGFAKSALKLWHVYNLMKMYLLFARLLAFKTIGHTLSLELVRFTLHTIAESTESMSEIVDNLKKINFIVVWRATRGINYMYKLLFGDIRNRRKGLIDILLILTGEERFGAGMHKFNEKDAIAATICLKLLSIGLRSLLGTIALIALATPILPIAWLGTLIIVGITDILVEVFDILGDSRERKKIALGSLVILLICTTVLAFIATLLLIGLAIIQGWQVILIGLLGFALSILIMYGILYFLGKQLAEIGEGILVLLAMCAAMVLAALAILVISKVNFTWDMFGSVMIMVLILGVMAVFAVLLGVLMTTGIFELGLIALALLAVTILIVAVAFLVAAIVFQMLANMEIPEDVLLKVIKPLGVMFQYMLDNIKIFNPITMVIMLYTVAMCMVIVLLTMLMAVFVWVIDKITSKWSEEEMRNVLTSVYSPIMGLGQYFNEHSDVFNPLTLGLMLINVALIFPIVIMTTIISIATLVISKILRKIDWDEAKENIHSLFDAYLGEGGVVDQINQVSLWTIGKATAKMLAFTPMLITIAGMAAVISKVAKMEIPDKYNDQGKPISFHIIKPEEFKQAATNVATMVEFFVKVVCGGTTADGTTYEGCLENLESIKRKHRRGMRNLAGIVGSVSDMADTISKFATMRIPDSEKGWDEEKGQWKAWRLMKDTDFKEAAANVEYVTTFFVDLICGNSSKEGMAVGIAEKVYNRFKEYKNTEAFESFKTVIDTVCGMGIAIQNFANMLVPDPNSEWDEEKGRYKKYIPMRPEDYTKAKLNIQNIMTSMVDAITDASFTQKVEKMDEDVAELMGMMFDAMKGYTTVLDGMVKIYTQVNSIENPDVVQKRLIGMVTTLTDTKNLWLTTGENWGEVKQKYGFMCALADRLVSLSEASNNADNVERSMKAYGEFIKVVNNSKLDNLKYAYSLFKAMSQITKDIRGNFDHLAQVLNEDIIEQLRRIAELLAQINENPPMFQDPFQNTEPTGFTPFTQSSENPTPQNNVYDAAEVRRLLDGLELTLKNVTKDEASGYLKVKTLQ